MSWSASPAHTKMSHTKGLRLPVSLVNVLARLVLISMLRKTTAFCGSLCSSPLARKQSLQSPNQPFFTDLHVSVLKTETPLVLSLPSPGITQLLPFCKTLIFKLYIDKVRLYGIKSWRSFGKLGCITTLETHKPQWLNVLQHHLTIQWEQAPL